MRFLSPYNFQFLLCSFLVKPDKEWKMHQNTYTEQKSEVKMNIFCTFLSLILSATPQGPLYFFQLLIVIPPGTPSLAEMIFSHLIISFVYFPKQLNYEIYHLQISEFVLSKLSTAKHNLTQILTVPNVVKSNPNPKIRAKNVPDLRFLQISCHKN